MTYVSWIKFSALIMFVGLALWSAGLAMQEHAANINFTVDLLKNLKKG